MSVQDMALKLPTADKLRLMEALWIDLSQTENDLTSPPWHETTLKETEERYKNGLEQPVSWSQAKHLLQGE